MSLKGLRAERREQAVRLILDAATEVFAEQGYIGTSMDDIAKRVGCAPASLYGYFKGKARIFGRIWEEKSDAYLDQIGSTLSEADDFDSAITSYLAHFQRSLEENADFVRLLITVLATHDTGALPAGEATQQHHVRHVGLLAAVMKRGLQEGVLLARPPELLGISFLGMLHATVFAWMVAGAEDPIQPLLDNVRSLFLHGAAKGSP